MPACSRTLLLCGLLSTIAACSTHKPAAPLTAEEQKKADEEQQKKLQEAAQRGEQYLQFQSNIHQLEVGRSTTDSTLALLGKPARIAGENWIYDVSPSVTDPVQTFTLSFRNGLLAAISSSGSVYVMPR